MSGRRDLHGALWQSLRRRVLATEQDCGICRRPVDKGEPYWLVDEGGRRRMNPRAASVDHIRPVARDGDPFDRANLQLAHAGCNQAKWARRVVAPRPAPSRRWFG